MAKNNYAGMSADELKELAEEQKNRQAALREIARSDPAAMSAMTPNDRADFLRAREEERRDAWHEANNEARGRRLSAMEQIAARDRGRYSAVETKAAINWLNNQEQARRFDKTNETARLESENKKLGMIGQGSEAANAHAEAEKEKAKTEWRARTTIAEQQAAAQKYLAEQQTAAQKYGIDAENGIIGPDGKVTPGSKERIAELQGQNLLKVEQERGKTVLAQSQLQSLNSKLDRESQERIAQITASGRFNAAKVIAASREIAALTKNVFDPTEKAKIIAKYKENNKDNPDAIAAADALGGGGTEQFAR